MDAKLQELKARLLEVSDLNAAVSLLGWDQSTYMPAGGGAARARQLATLGRLAHERATDPALGRLLDALRPYEESLPYDSDDASIIRVARRDFERANRVPPAFVAELSEHAANLYERWARARPANNFAAVRDGLERTVEYSRQLAGFFPGYEHIADPLIDMADFGMTVAEIRPLFAELRARLVPLVEAVAVQPPADDSCLRRGFPEQEQLAFGLEVAARLGYDLQRGRQDKTLHPFAVRIAGGDVRITTRVREDDFSDAFFSTVHEAGHAMYEQGVAEELDATPLAGGTSAGVHESQSRLWENLVGRSRPFWEHLYPQLQARFPAQLGEVPLETFYRAINKVQRSLIRTDADELTYNLHVIIRFDLELELLEGALAVRDLPEAWRERYRRDLGIAPPDDRDGALQDVHWYGGVVGGAFQGYTLGNILSAQFYDAAVRAHPEIPQQIGRGEFGTLHAWLREHIYRHGRKYTASELVVRAAGGPLSIDPYLAYLRAKYGELYGF
ncbi:MAG TPA: carboxypeptidase M32 [Roseiflexaceae bacterium]|nr:carboxypeptidase M32 [Roseiflexaceae bacterium]